jgi:hypothetical protein
MAKREVHRQECAEARARSDQDRMLVVHSYERDHFVEDVRLPDNVAQHTLARMNVVVVPGFRAVAIDAVNLYEPGIDLVGQRVYHQKVFPLIETTPGAWKDQNGRARMPEDQHLHIAAHARAEPFNIIFRRHGV